jgi:CRP-like cAMP-binding protein
VREGEAAYTTRGPKPLASAIGVRTPLRIDTFFVDLHRNDRILLATDGAYTAVPDEATMTRICQKPPELIARDICTLALDKGGRDNATVLVVRIGDRFLSRAATASQRENDFGTIQENPLFIDLPMSKILSALAAGIEVDVEDGARVTAADAGDLCAYLVLDGVVRLGNGTSLGSPALLFAESLVGVSRDAAAATVTSRARLIRIRGDDFREVCLHDAGLGSALYERLARHLARTLR